jgi:hypothetical protein
MSESQFCLILANIWLASSKQYGFGLAIGLFYLIYGIVIGLAK